MSPLRRPLPPPEERLVAAAVASALRDGAAITERNKLPNDKLRAEFDRLYGPALAQQTAARAADPSRRWMGET